jgi:hypothetical protein
MLSRRLNTVAGCTMILCITLHQKEKMMKDASFLNLGAEEIPDLSNYNVLLIQLSKLNP